MIFRVPDGMMAWHAGSWGVVFEVLFETEEQWQAVRFSRNFAENAAGRY
jgi:hypothetical protein